ncbi:MAG: 23S rRNA (adenine(2503)-C(2))-methyltransferase RlmN [Proteobacteria bacterium]|nr:23S rRNA (adenine(2503)-C(2))-methyltransferase RlmN [Pseudomonadota bacterium]
MLASDSVRNASSERFNLLNADRVSLEKLFSAQGEKPFRARQVFSRLHKNGGRNNELAACLQDLPAATRARFSELVHIDELPLATVIPASDGVYKLLFSVGAGQQIEAVIIPEAQRITLCISSQVGCALACKFCLTGKQGFARNLTTAEIVAQLRVANRFLQSQGSTSGISNIVMMGMGEPLLNADAVLPALRLFTDTAAYALTPRRVTVSTAGVVPAMARLAADVPVSLAVSLHAPTNALRDEIMPVNRKYPLASLMTACQQHIINRPRAYVTFEYVMLDGINDSPACARDLVRLLHGIRCKVNLIPFNPFSGASYQCSSPATIQEFRSRLLQSGVMTTIRKTRGDDILAACGQLAGDVHARTMGLAGRAGQSESPIVRHSPQ